MNKKKVLWMFILILIIGMTGCGKVENPIVADLTTGGNKASKAIAYYQGNDLLMYRKDYEDAESEYVITHFYNSSFFLDSDVMIDPENRYLYYQIPTEDVYGELYRVDTDSLIKDHINPGELVEENVVRKNLQFIAGGILFQKYENEVWSLYYSCPGEAVKQILDGDVVNYYINEEDIYIVEKIDADEHAKDRLRLWKYNIKTDEREEVDQSVYDVSKGRNKTEVLLYSKWDDNGRALYGIKKNGEIIQYIKNAWSYRNESDDENIDIMFLKETGNSSFDLYQYDGNREILLEKNIEKTSFSTSAFTYIKDGQRYIYINKIFLRLSPDIDLENKMYTTIEGVLENGDLIIKYTINGHQEGNTEFKYNYALWKVENGEIVTEKELAGDCDKYCSVVKESFSDETIRYLYANTSERSNAHQLSIMDTEGNLRPVDTDFFQGYLNGTDIYSLKADLFGNMQEANYETLYGKGRIEKYENECTLSVIHVSEDFIEENVLDDQVEQILFAENGTVFYISNGDLLRIDQEEKIRMVPSVSYVWATHKNLKQIGGRVLDTKTYGNRF